ncbi:MAG: glycoside hydrolase family 95 protein [Chthoniobacterales bacterium]
MLARATAHGEEPAENLLKLWYAQPAVRWMESVPVGNGRIGAMVFGGADTARIALNESTVWSGEPSDRHLNPGTRSYMQEMRTALFEGRYEEAMKLCQQYMVGFKRNYGSHLPMGDLLLQFKHPGTDVKDYRRELDLDEAVARVEYAIGERRYKTEVLCSNPDDVLVIRLSSDKPGGLSFEVGMNGGDKPFEVRAEAPDTLVMTGNAFEKNHSNGKTGVAFRGQIKALPTGGQLVAEGNSLKITNADAVLLLVAINTNYLGRDAAALCRSQLDAAAKKTYEQLRDPHVTDHRRLFRRVTLDLGATDAAKLPTDKRLELLKSGGADPQLATLFFQYGRYLMIAGSRENSPLPLNLQGIWNDNLACNMGWTCDFHMDINTQQNYWPSESCNLTECHEPLFKLIESLREPGAKTARNAYDCNGWVCHVFTNAWGFTASGWALGWGIHVTGGTWLASHMWDHYEFTGDKEFLAKRAYPTLKGSAEFFLDYMVEDPKTHWLVTGPASSPENAYRSPDGKVCTESMGPTCDVVLVRDLFEHCIEASKTLNTDADFRAKLEAAVKKLPPLQIGKDGQLQEWQQDYEEAIPNHRHMTHLISLYPSDQITPHKTPDLAKAARVSMERRTNRPDWEDVEWSRSNLINFYARLLDGEAAHNSLLLLLTKLSDKNLMSVSVAGIAGAPENIFAIDGNTSGANGIAEMLLQSQDGEISLLPALPEAWRTGKVTGLKARGGHEVDIAWKDGKLTEAKTHSMFDGMCKIRAAVPIQVTKGSATIETATPESGVVAFTTEKGGTYRIVAQPE